MNRPPSHRHESKQERAARDLVDGAITIDLIDALSYWVSAADEPQLRQRLLDILCKLELLKTLP